MTLETGAMLCGDIVRGVVATFGVWSVALASTGFAGRSGSGLSALAYCGRRGCQSRKSTGRQTVRSRNGSLTQIPTTTQLLPHATAALSELAVAS